MQGLWYSTPPSHEMQCYYLYWHRKILFACFVPDHQCSGDNGVIRILHLLNQFTQYQPSSSNTVLLYHLLLIFFIFTFLIWCFRSQKQINVLTNVEIHNLIVEVWSNMTFFINIYFFSFLKTDPPGLILIHQCTSALKETSSESKGLAYLPQTIGSAFRSVLMSSIPSDYFQFQRFIDSLVFWFRNSAPPEALQTRLLFTHSPFPSSLPPFPAFSGGLKRRTGGTKSKITG